MLYRDQILNARASHAWLRDRFRKAQADHEALSHLHNVRKALETVWAGAKEHPQGPYIRQAIRRLQTDAELHAGVGETEVFRDSDSLWKEYDFLEQTFPAE